LCYNELVARVEFFTPEDGKSPIKEFIDRCEIKQQVKILRFLKYLEEFGLTTAIPNCRKLAGTPLWEIRILGRDNIRIFYTPIGENRIVVLHIFSKKKQKTPRKEVNVALKRYQFSSSLDK